MCLGSRALAVSVGRHRRAGILCMAGYRDEAPYILPPRMAFDTSAVHVDIPLPDFSYYGHEYEGLAGYKEPYLARSRSTAL